MALLASQRQFCTCSLSRLRYKVCVCGPVKPDFFTLILLLFCSAGFLITPFFKTVPVKFVPTYVIQEKKLNLVFILKQIDFTIKYSGLCVLFKSWFHILLSTAFFLWFLDHPLPFAHIFILKKSALYPYRAFYGLFFWPKT